MGLIPSTTISCQPVSSECRANSRIPKITRYRPEYGLQTQRLFRQLVSIMDGDTIARFECIDLELIKGGIATRLQQYP